MVVLLGVGSEEIHRRNFTETVRCCFWFSCEKKRKGCLASSFLSFYPSKLLFINSVADPDCPVGGGQGSCVGRLASQQSAAGSAVAGMQLAPMGAKRQLSF